MIFTPIILGLVEGLTEFLPVSSTGHLIVAGHLLGFTGPQAATFEIVIQLGAILAVVWEYRFRLVSLATASMKPQGGTARGLVMNLLLAFLPAAVAGLLLHRLIEERLFGPITVAGALIAGGIAMLGIERAPLRMEVDSLDAIPWTKALCIGLAQTLSLFPGISRAAATIMGGMVAGLTRRTATEFSFLLAIPTLLAATGYDLLKSWKLLGASELGQLGIGFVVAFFSALVTVRGLLRFISNHDFRLFAWYRIAFGAVVLAYFSR